MRQCAAAQSSDDAYRERRLTLGLAYTINQHLGLRVEQGGQSAQKSG